GQASKSQTDYSRCLQDFTVSVLRRRPTNLVHFAAAYFRRLDLVNSAVEGDAVAVLTVPAREDSGAETDDDLDIAAAAAAAAAEAGKVPPWRANRRPSVAAPSFDPEKSEATYQRKIVPKSDEQRRRLTETVKHILLFRSLDRVSLSHVIDAMQELSVKAGDMIIEQDQEGDNFYVIERGIFEAYVTDSVSGERRLGVTYNHSGSFGELALMYYCPRAATVIAKTDGVLWSLDLDTFQQKVLMSAFKNRKKYEAFLAAVSLLSELTHYERAECEPILFQGDPGNEMFFVEEGSVKVMRRHSDNGLETQPRAASCYSVGRTRVCVLHVSDFERLLGPCLEVMRRNIDSYRSQLREIFGDATSAAAAPLRVEASV
uniref:cAMP-dependent protein kinase type II regulatory subunit n=1 Tax=Macrostomum lignano TaxID=282301 RepID=A0A1I8IJL4_9PLAT